MSRYFQWAPYVSVAKRLHNAQQLMKKRARQGHPVNPVCIEGRTIARTPWGKAWCAHLEAYSDYANRLPRGRRYACNGSVVDLQLTPGQIAAYIAGSSTYHATITVQTLPRKQWQALCGDCAGSIESLLELLRGKFDQAIMQRLCRPDDGLFPSPKQLHFSCSCPDGARMCKHIAAVLYGVGNRLDEQPELLFTLRKVNPDDLIASAGAGLRATTAPSDDATLAVDDLGDLFGLDLEDSPAAPPAKRGRGRPHRQTPAPTRARASQTSPASPEPPSGRSLYARLYRHLAKAGSLTNTEAQLLLNRDAAQLRPLFKRLVAEGHASVSGRTRGTTYHCTAP